MNEAIATTKRRLLSTLLVGFGAFTLIFSIMWAFIFDAVVIDIGGLIVICLAASLAHGSARAAKWSRILMIYYFVAAVLLLTLGIVAPERISIAGRAIRPGELPYALLFAGIAGAWALVNLTLLWKHRSAFPRAMPKGR